VIQAKFGGMQSEAFMGQRHHIPRPILMAYSPCKSLLNDPKRYPEERATAEHSVYAAYGFFMVTLSEILCVFSVLL
jgi:hypothetical protein